MQNSRQRIFKAYLGKNSKWSTISVHPFQQLKYSSCLGNQSYMKNLQWRGLKYFRSNTIQNTQPWLSFKVKLANSTSYASGNKHLKSCSCLWLPIKNISAVAGILCQTWNVKCFSSNRCCLTCWVFLAFFIYISDFKQFFFRFSIFITLINVRILMGFRGTILRRTDFGTSNLLTAHSQVFHHVANNYYINCQIP